MKKVLLTAAALALSTSAIAGPSWTYGDVSYIRGDSGDQDTEGYGVRGSFGFADKWHVRGEFKDGEVEGGSNPTGGADDDAYNLVVGIHPAITDSTDFVFELSYFDGSVDSFQFDSNINSGREVGEDADGYGLTIGLRSMIADNLEVNGFVTSISGDEKVWSGSEFGSSDFTEIEVTVGGQYFFTDNIGLGVDVNVGDGDSANFYARYSF
jgi:hypothetical protein